ncbi:hypothetical protein AgCh_010450 [Apium graveolens]
MDFGLNALTNGLTIETEKLLAHLVEEELNKHFCTWWKCKLKQKDKLVQGVCMHQIQTHCSFYHANSY